MIQVLRIVVFITALFYGTVIAAEKTPSPKAGVPVIGPITDAKEYTYFRKAMRAADNDHWDAVRSFRAGVSTPAGQNLLLWRLAVADRHASFFELKNAIETLQTWPRHNKMRIEAEKKISTSGMETEFIIKYFDKWAPLTGTGKLAFAHALNARDFTVETQAQIRSAWHNNDLTKSQEKEILKAFGPLLTPEDHAIRTDTMIWGRHRLAASRMLNRLKGDEKAVATARIKLMRNANGIDGALHRVPKAREDDGGLLFERAYWRRRHGLSDDAVELVLQFPEGSQNPVAAKRMWTERHLLARRAIKDKKYATAYALVSRHGMSRGGNFADGEWLAGWLALQKLRDPILALSHFRRLKEGVSMPVSLARAYYWMGRAQQTMGATEAAQIAWQKASMHDFTYYGQLAAHKVGGKTLELGQDPEPTTDQRAAFESNLQIKALKLIGLAGNTSLFRTFSYHLDDLLPNAVDHVMLANLAKTMGHNRAAMRAAKAALWRGEILPDSAWPVLALPESLPVDNALLLALMRQETELDPQAISPVGARGLMQLMPSTARITARSLGIPYRKSWLTSDPGYNINLGTGHLQELLDEFDDSYILAAVSYNAGRTRAYRWIKEYGDPRTETDPIDWVETIPFSETRNYVQRVLENVQVYRHRLAKMPVPITIWADLNRGYRVPAASIETPSQNCVTVTLPDPKGTRVFCPDLPQG